MSRQIYFNENVIWYGKPDSGIIEIFENKANISSPKEAINLGMGWFISTLCWQKSYSFRKYNFGY